MVNKVESRYVMEPSTDKNSGNVLEWWSAESKLSIWPSAKQVEKKFLNVACRAVVLNETLYQRVASTNVTSVKALTEQQVQRSRAPSVSSTSGSPTGQQHQVSASMASSQHSRDSYSFTAASKGQSILGLNWLLHPFIATDHDGSSRHYQPNLTQFHFHPVAYWKWLNSLFSVTCRLIGSACLSYSPQLFFFKIQNKNIPVGGLISIVLTLAFGAVRHASTPPTLEESRKKDQVLDDVSIGSLCVSRPRRFQRRPTDPTPGGIMALCCRFECRSTQLTWHRPTSNTMICFLWFDAGSLSARLPKTDDWTPDTPSPSQQQQTK